MAQPTPVTVTDINGNQISITGASLGLFAQVPLTVMPTDLNGNPLTLTSAVSVSQIASPTPIVICDSRGYAYNLPIVVTSNGASIITVSSTTQASGRKGQPLPVVLTDKDGNPLTITGATLGAFIGAPTSIVLSDYRGYPITLTLSNNVSVTISTFAGSPQLAGAYAGDGGAPYAATLNNPAGVALDAAGNVYFCDLSNGYIRCINMQPTTQVLFNVSIPSGDIKAIAGNGTNAFSGDGGQATSAALGHPCYIAFDASGNMYVADQQNGCIRKITTAGVISTPLGGVGGHLYDSFLPGDGAVAFTLSACGTASGGNTVYTGTFPLNVANGQHIYIQGFTNAANNGWFTSVGTGSSTQITLNNASGSAETHAATANYATLNYPQAVYVDAAGNIWVADTNNSRIRVYNTQGTTQTFLGTSVLAGQINTVVGLGNQPTSTNGGYSGDGGAATSAYIFWPLGFTFDTFGNLYFADSTNNVVRKVTTAGVISTVAGSKTTVNITNVAFSAGSSTYTYTITSGPALVVAAQGYITISGCTTTANNGCFKIASLGTGTFTVVNASGVTEAESSATGIAGIPGFSGDAGQATSAQISQPFDVRFDASGNMYVAEGVNNIIRKITSAGVTSTYAGNFATYGTTGGFGGDLGPLAQAGLSVPVSLALSGSTLYIAEFSNNVIRKIAPSAYAKPQLVASGLGGLHGTGVQASPLVLNTTGATLLIAVASGYVPGGTNTPATISDSVGGQSNSWNALTTYKSTSSGATQTITIYYAYAKTGGGPLQVGASHSFTPAIASGDASIIVFACSGTKTDATVYDSATGTAGPLSSPFQPGSITPTVGDIVVTGFCNVAGSAHCSLVGAGSDTLWAGPYRAVSINDGGAGASILIYASGNAVNPTWTSSVASNVAAIACFKKA